jgi:hypothetical protein
MSTRLSSIVPEIETFRWTPRMEESFRILEVREEVPNDKILVHLVQMQLVLGNNKSKQTSGDSAPAHEDLPDDQMALFSDMKTKILNSAHQDGTSLFFLFHSFASRIISFLHFE